MARFKPGQSGSPQTQFQAGNRHRWQPGQSGNPTGITRSRAEFEERFYTALLGHGSAEEVASLLWDCAREREPWAIQALLQRVAPETKQLKVNHGLQDHTPLDYSKLSDDELNELHRLAERASVSTSLD